MLKSLFIQNYALIDKLDISFEPGFSVITGETGAGKSIILGAIGLLLGQRADAKAIKSGAAKCVVEAKFAVGRYGLEDFFKEIDIDFDPEECIIRREVSRSGKSRGFINDSPATVSQMRSLGEKLIDVHSQHQNLLLNKEGFQLNILDIVAHDDRQLTDYKHTYDEYRKTSSELEALIARAARSRQDEDYISYQLRQLEEANLQEDEQEELEQEASTLSHAEEIKAALYASGQAIGVGDESMVSRGKESIQALRGVSHVYPDADEWAERLDSCLIELKDLARDITSAEEGMEFNPSRLDYINDRLNHIYSLEQKHHVSTVSELLSLEQSYREQLEGISASDEEIEQLRQHKDALMKEVIRQASCLTSERSRSAKLVEDKMHKLLVPLGMPNVRFAIELSERREPGPSGMDGVSFLFSANKNVPMQDVSSIASGGETGRVMLSLKAMIAGAVKLPTIIFDEIDTGVSGKIAEQMALMMRDMGKEDRQVISITHLPQIAARGSVHYKVYKKDTESETVSQIVRLSMQERIKEIANMLSGATLTEAALSNAKELLNSD